LSPGLKTTPHPAQQVPDVVSYFFVKIDLNGRLQAEQTNSSFALYKEGYKLCLN
jgi:hypothetical protein